MVYSTNQHADVVVIGGGIVGASIAYHLARSGAGRIVLLERESMLGTGSTGRCAGGFRYQFSTEVNIRLSLLSIPMILNFAEELGCPVDIHQNGYLFLLANTREMETFRENVTLQNRMGIASEFLEPEQIARRAPHVCLDGVLAGTYCAQDGIGEPNGMTQGYASAARRMGVDIQCGTAATGLRVSGHSIEGVETARCFIPCGSVVNAAGPYARQVAAWAGVDLPVFPERRHVYTTLPFPQAPGDHLMVIDFSTTFYCHRESGGVLMGMARQGEESSFNLTVDPDFLEQVLEVALARYPALSEAGINRSWAGLYEMSPDAQPILGKAPGLNGFYLANGFSGHGFQHAPAVGKLIAEEITLGRAQSMDITPLRLDRFCRGQGAREINVV